jgi:hypothetical protein
MKITRISCMSGPGGHPGERPDLPILGGLREGRPCIDWRAYRRSCAHSSGRIVCLGKGGPGPAYGTGRLSGRIDAVADDVLELHRAFDHAGLRGDAERLGALLDDDFLSIGEQGYQLGKQEWIGRHGEFRYLSIETTEVDVRRYDKTAPARCRHRPAWSARGFR